MKIIIIHLKTSDSLKMKCLHPIVVLTIQLICTYMYTAAEKRIMNIGGVLSGSTFSKKFQIAVERVNKDAENLLPEDVRLNATYILMNDNPVRAARSICEELIPRQVYVVVASHPPTNDLAAMAVSFTCGFYNIPVIGLSARDSAFSDKNVHQSFMRTVPPYSDQAEAWVDIIKSFLWKKVIFIHSSDQEGRAMLGRFQNKAETSDIIVELNIQYTSGQDNFTDSLIHIDKAQSRVILLYAAENDAVLIYNTAERLGLTQPGYVWIVTEQALTVENVPQGVLGLRLVNSTNEDAHIEDAVHIIAQALKTMYPEVNITEPPRQCSNEMSSSWKVGKTLQKYLREEKLINGVTGKVLFNEVGDRINALYHVVNVDVNENTGVRTWKTVGQYGLVPPKKKKVPTATLR